MPFTHWTEFDRRLHENVLPVIEGVPLKVHPDGAVRVNPVIAYALDDGLAIAIVNAVVEVPENTLGEIVMVGREEFAAFTGATAGIKISIPDTTSSPSKSPELNFFRYAFVSVYMFSRSWHGNSI